MLSQSPSVVGCGGARACAHSHAASPCAILPSACSALSGRPVEGAFSRKRSFRKKLKKWAASVLGCRDAGGREPRARVAKIMAAFQVSSSSPQQACRHIRHAVADAPAAAPSEPAALLLCCPDGAGTGSTCHVGRRGPRSRGRHGERSAPQGVRSGAAGSGGSARRRRDVTSLLTYHADLLTCLEGAVHALHGAAELVAQPWCTSQQCNKLLHHSSKLETLVGGRCSPACSRQGGCASHRLGRPALILAASDCKSWNTPRSWLQASWRSRPPSGGGSHTAGCSSCRGQRATRDFLA